MFTPGPDGTGLAEGAGEDGTGAGADVAGWAAGVDAAGDERGHSRKAPRPARARTMTMKAILRCAGVRSMGPELLPAADRAEPERGRAPLARWFRCGRRRRRGRRGRPARRGWPCRAAGGPAPGGHPVTAGSRAPPGRLPG